MLLLAEHKLKRKEKSLAIIGKPYLDHGQVLLLGSHYLSLRAIVERVAVGQQTHTHTQVGRQVTTIQSVHSGK